MAARVLVVQGLIPQNDTISAGFRARVAVHVATAVARCTPGRARAAHLGSAGPTFT